MNNLSEKLIEFLEKKPLYSWQKFEWREYSTECIYLSQIEMECSTCKRSRSFSERDGRSSGAGSTLEAVEESGIYSFWFACDTCGESEYAFLI
jgi:hypothetical protein